MEKTLFWKLIKKYKQIYEREFEIIHILVKIEVRNIFGKSIYYYFKHNLHFQFENAK